MLTADTYTSVLTDLLAYAAEATTKLVLAAAARNPGPPAPAPRSFGEIRCTERNRLCGTPAEQAVRTSEDDETEAPTYVPPASHKDQGRIARKLYGLLKLCAPRRT